MGTVVMLIWISYWGAGAQGGPATIEGFSDYKACGAAIEKVAEGYKKMGFEIKANCITIQK